MPLVILVATLSLILGVLLTRWFKKASKDDKRSLILLSTWTLSGLGLVALILTGRFFQALGWALMLFIALLISGASARRKRYQKKQQNDSGNGLLRDSSLTEKQAYGILGLKVGAPKRDIQKAYINLIKKNHPDNGGSDVLSAQINAAYDILMDPKRND